MSEYPNKVLLATDGTEDSARAARAAVALANSSGAELHVVHVGHAGPALGGAPAMRPALPGEPPGYAEQQARKLLERQVEEIRAANGTVTGVHLRMGQPAPEVVAVAAEIGADLLVVGSGRPRPVRRTVAATTRQPALGRASDVIVRAAHCPVLVVRGDAVPGVGREASGDGRGEAGGGDGSSRRT